MSTDAGLRMYVQAIPEVYRKILASFPLIEPERETGDGLTFQSIAAEFKDRRIEYTLADIISGCGQLQIQGVLEIRQGERAHPTAYGERLITLITGVHAKPRTIPQLSDL